MEESDEAKSKTGEKEEKERKKRLKLARPGTKRNSRESAYFCLLRELVVEGVRSGNYGKNDKTNEQLE